MQKSYIIICIVWFAVSALVAQEEVRLAGISVGYIRTQLLDEYISLNEYTAGSFAYGVSWEDRNEQRVTGLVFNFNQINGLSQGNSSAEASDFYVSFWYAYRIGRFMLSDKPVLLSLGRQGK